MKKITKSLLLIMTMVVLCFAMSICTSAISSSGKCGENVTYTYNSTTKEVVISGTGAMTEYSSSNSPFNYSKIETVVIENGVTSIGNYTFYSCGSLTSITIPNSVTSIGNDAFYGCGNLENITLPNSLTSIGDGAFSYTAYYNDSSNWESDVLYIGNYLIEAKTSLTGTYNIKDGTTIVSEMAFYACSKLENIFVPVSVKHIGDDAFLGVNFVTVADNNTEYSSDDFGVLFNKDKTVLIQYPTVNSRTSYVVPDSVLEISVDAFYYCETLSEIKLSNNLKIIGSGAFNHCYNLSDIELPYGLEIIERGAFAGCSKISNIVLPDTLIKIGITAFGACSSLTSIAIPKNITTIEASTFSNCSSLTNIKLHENIKEIGVDAFKNVAYSYDESGVLYIDNYCVGTKSKSNPKGSYTIKDGTIGIADEVFVNNQNLQEIIMPDSLTFIGKRSFQWCWGLRMVTFGQNVETIGFEAFVGNYNMKGFEIPDSVTHIGDGAFENCEEFSAHSIGKNIKSIGNKTFFGCDFTEVTIPEGVVSIGRDAFSCCTALKKVNIPNTVKEILSFAFNSTKLTDVFYNGYKQEWETIAISSANEELLNANIHYLHEHTYEPVITPPTCTEKGYTTYTCHCNDTYIDDYVGALGHSYTSEITTPATHLTDGVETFTCSCGDTYTEAVAKTTKHTYEATVTAPTCTEKGYTTYTCHCNDTYIADEVDALGHDMSDFTETLAPTCTEIGEERSACSRCDYFETRDIIAIGHDYETVVTEPTCTEKGYTTYTCHCSDTYVADETKALGHEYRVALEAPSCTKQGMKITYCINCTESTTETIPALDHTDKDENDYCDVCKEDLDPVAHCSCNCHKDGIISIIWKIINFFNKLFRSNPTCMCGVAHY